MAAFVTRSRRVRRARCARSFVLCWLLACPPQAEPSMGSAPSAGAPITGNTAGVSAPLLDAALNEPVPANGVAPECEGFPLRGLTHSPGGSVLPNRCAPFHPTLN